jgi:signal transduction histidine kinase
VRGLEIGGLGGCAAALVVYNTAVVALLRRLRRLEQARAYPWWVGISHVTITLDFLVLTYLIWLVGGARSPFLAFYLLHVILAAVLLSRRAAYAHALIGYLLLAGLVVGEGLGWLPQNRPEGAVPAGARIEARYVLTVLFVYGLLMALAAFLMSGLAEALRAGEVRLRQANQELQRLSEMRRAFLHIALHDLKSPIAAIAMLLDNLVSGLGGPLTQQQGHWVRRAKQRLGELLEFLRDLQVLGELESADIAAQAGAVDMGALARKVAEEQAELAQQRRQTLSVELPSELPAAQGVERLLREALANYLSNAIKYTPEGGSIRLRAARDAAMLRVEVQDSGRGIAAQDQERLFNEFVRIPASDQAGPPVSGTGLGLSIVRRIAEAHGGRVGVVSALGKGSTFFFELPVAGAGTTKVKGKR